MYKIMKALRDVDYDGIVIPDHVPRMGSAVAPAAGAPAAGAPAAGRGAGGGRGAANDASYQAALAYSIAYMRALRDRANREAKA
jgi:hypothetical protein